MDEVRPAFVFDRTAALGRLDDDEDLLNDVVGQFVEDAPAALAAIETAIGQGDGPALRDAAHTLKGAAAYLAADHLCAMAQTLEGFGQAGQLAQARAVWPAFAGMAAAVVDALRGEQNRS
jgi:HPt (histidine-containing phosphotransfer) domain-containing protein